jgi:hypothetical protein
VVWHTQGNGESLTMVFYGERLVLEPRRQNPTIVVITDRNDLDDQLYGTFSRCYELLRQAPVQAEDREHLRSLVQVSSGGVVFTTIQKFMPTEGERYPQLSAIGREGDGCHHIGVAQLLRGDRSSAATALRPRSSEVQVLRGNPWTLSGRRASWKLTERKRTSQYRSAVTV